MSFAWAGIVQSVQQLATCWTVRGSNPGGDEVFRTCPDRPWGLPSLLYNGYRVFPGGKVAEAWRWPPTPIYRRGYRKSRAIPLLPLWAFVACSGVNFMSLLRSPKASVFQFWVSHIQIFVCGVLISVRVRTRCGLINTRTAVSRKVACCHDISVVMTFATHSLYSRFFRTQFYVTVICVNHDCASPVVLAQSLMRRILHRYNDVHRNLNLLVCKSMTMYLKYRLFLKSTLPRAHHSQSIDVYVKSLRAVERWFILTFVYRTDEDGYLSAHRRTFVSRFT